MERSWGGGEGGGVAAGSLVGSAGVGPGAGMRFGPCRSPLGLTTTTLIFTLNSFS